MLKHCIIVIFYLYIYSCDIPVINYISQTYTVSQANLTSIFNEGFVARTLISCLIRFPNEEHGFIIYDSNQNLCIFRTCNIEQYHDIGEDYQVRQFFINADRAGK